LIDRIIIFLKKGSVARQIGVAVFLIFSVMMLFNAFVVQYNSQNSMQDQIKKQVIQINQGYFDSLNTLMLTGTMHERELLRSKMLKNPNVVDVRVLRSDLLGEQYGQGESSEVVADDIDRQALEGQEIIQINESSDEQRILTVALPYRATAASHGVNCLQCHNGPDTHVVGAVRIDYSLRQSDEIIAGTLWQSIVVSFTVLLIGIALLAWYMNRTLTQAIREADIFAEAIAEQNFDVETPAVRSDNLGRLIYSMIKMRDALKAQLITVQASNQIELKEMEDKMERQAKESNLVVAFESGIVSIVRDLSVIAADAGRSAASLSHISTQINQSSSSALSGTDHALLQVANITKDTHAINWAFKDINERSQAAIDISKRAMDDAIATSERMETLQKASDGISSVTATITEIAEKTNLLALNASIEAARAGDVGRGFAVVANEVKSLSNQTREATEVISKQIEGVQSESRDAIAAIEGINQVIIQMNKHTLDVAEIMSQYTDTLNMLETNAEVTDQEMKSVYASVEGASQSAEEGESISAAVAMHCEKMQDISLEHSQLVEQFLSMLQGLRKNADDTSDEEYDDEDELF